MGDERTGDNIVSFVIPRSALIRPMPGGAGVPISLADRRPPVTYTIRLRHGWDDSLAVWVQDVADDERSRHSIADALRRAADMIDPSSGAEPPDA